MPRDPDGRLGFPFTSKEAQYLWACYWENVPPWQYDAPPAPSNALQVYEAAVAAWRTTCEERNLRCRDDLFDAARSALSMWAAAPPAARGQIAVAAAKAIYDAAKGQSALLTGSRGLAFRPMVVANARVLETLVVSLECISAPDPNLARAVWTFARDAPYGRPGGTSDIPKYWREKIDELRSEFQRSRLKDSPEVKAALAAADALGPALTSLHAAFGAKDPVGLARELVGTRDKVAELAAAVRGLPRAALQDAGPIRDAFDNALAEVIGMTWTRLDQTYRETLPRAAVLRGSTTIGGHRAGGEAGGIGTGFFTAEPDGDPPRAEPPAVPPPVHVDPSHVDPARLDPSREGEHGL